MCIPTGSKAQWEMGLCLVLFSFLKNIITEMIVFLLKYMIPRQNHSVKSMLFIAFYYAQASSLITPPPLCYEQTYDCEY